MRTIHMPKVNQKNRPFGLPKVNQKNRPFGLKVNQKNRPFGLWFVVRNSASTACRPTKVVAK